MFEVAGPAGQISIDFNAGYGFTAIIVAFLGRLHPVGILLAGLLMALTYIGGEAAQSTLGLPRRRDPGVPGDAAVLPAGRRRADQFPHTLWQDGGRVMDLSSINPLILLASLMVASTPILLAAIGEMVVEKAGVLNLGVEGMMITGAVCGFAIAVETGSPAIGFVAAPQLAGRVLSLLFGFLTQYLLSNQVATGLALTLFGLGLSALIGQGYVGIKAPVTNDVNIPLLSDIPVIGRIAVSA